MILKLFDELIEAQKMKLLTLAQKIIPQVIMDDLLQPNDFPELENNPIFRYEEGILEGLMAAKVAYQALRAELAEKEK